MKINKLNNNKFYEFASNMMGVDVTLYKDVLELQKVEKGVKLKLYLGGEREDERCLYFKDTKCVYVNNAISSAKQDVSYEWIMYVLENAEELTDEEKAMIVEDYNNNLENEIKNYASQKREQLICL